MTKRRMKGYSHVPWFLFFLFLLRETLFSYCPIYRNEWNRRLNGSGFFSTNPACSLATIESPVNPHEAKAKKCNAKKLKRSPFSYIYHTAHRLCSLLLLSALFPPPLLSLSSPFTSAHQGFLILVVKRTRLGSLWSWFSVCIP
jgi:hypothetical protein